MHEGDYEVKLLILNIKKCQQSKNSRQITKSTKEWQSAKNEEPQTIWHNSSQV